MVLQYEETISNLITNNKEAKTKLEEEIQKLQVTFKSRGDEGERG